MRVNDNKSSGLGTILLSMAAIGLAGMIGTISLIHQAGELGPKVGDIISFDPLDSMSRDMKARLSAAHAETGTSCVLDVRTMHAGGGSVIIEARQQQTARGFRVHWAGQQSSNDNADCGASADLLLNLDDIEVLAMAAGGYGVAARKFAHASFAGMSRATE